MRTCVRQWEARASWANALVCCCGVECNERGFLGRVCVCVCLCVGTTLLLLLLFYDDEVLFLLWWWLLFHVKAKMGVGDLRLA